MQLHSSKGPSKASFWRSLATVQLFQDLPADETMGQSRSKLIPDDEEGHEIGMPVTPQRSATTSRAKRRQKKKSSEESVAEPTSRRRSTSLRYGKFLDAI